MRFEQGAEIVRGRSWGMCEMCGTARGSQTHHRQPRGMGGVSGVGMAVNTPAGLVRVCSPCHDRTESQRESARELGHLVPRPYAPAEVPIWLHHVNGRGWWLLGEDGNMTWLDRAEPSHSRL